MIISLPTSKWEGGVFLMTTYDIFMFIFSGICAFGTIFSVIDTLKKNHKKKDDENKEKDIKK